MKLKKITHLVAIPMASVMMMAAHAETQKGIATTSGVQLAGLSVADVDYAKLALTGQGAGLQTGINAQTSYILSETGHGWTIGMPELVIVLHSLLPQVTNGMGMSTGKVGIAGTVEK